MKRTSSYAANPSGIGNRGYTRFWIALLACLLAPLTLKAAIQVTTIAGGPSQSNTNAAGYADGNSIAVSKFNYPQGLALDSAGDLLVADKTNGAVRILTVPGTAESVTETVITNLANPVGVVVDAFDNIYVLTYGGTNLSVNVNQRGQLQEFGPGGNYIATLATNLSNPTALAIDDLGNLFFTDETGALHEVAIDNSLSTIASGFSHPQGVTVLNGGMVAVADTGNNAIRAVDPATHVVSTITGGNGAGLQNGSPAFAKFNQPYGLATAPNGDLIVADRFNHCVRLVDTNGIVSTLYGVTTNFWTPDYYPGWEDGGTTVAASREPVGATVAQDGTVFVSEDYWQILREVTGASLANQVVTTNGTNIITFVVPPTFTPTYGYFPMGVKIQVSSRYPAVYYTTDGSLPTTNSFPVFMTNGVGTIRWINPLSDISTLQVVAYNGTNASAVVSGGLPAVTEVGISRDVEAGSGSVAYIPISVNLTTRDSIRTFQFRVDFTPSGSAPPLPPLEGQMISTNDFVALPDVSEPNAVAEYNVLPYSVGTVSGAGVFAISTNANFVVKQSSVLALLRVHIPPTAQPGDFYYVDVYNISATSDGFQAAVPLVPMPSRKLKISSLPYVVGDVSPGGWYQAGDFGAGYLQNSDVNSVFYASMGIQVPYAGSDAYDAMDAFPEDVAGVPGGDGLIRFLDWEVVLLRSLGFEADIWARGWVYPGVITNWIYSGPGAVSTPFSTVTTREANREKAKVTTSTNAPGDVWLREAAFSFAPPLALNPGATVSIPIYVKVGQNYSLSGLEFRANVVGENGAPPVTLATFIPAPSIPLPTAALPSGVVPAGSFGLAWSLESFLPALTGTNLLGYLQFRVPPSAQAGQIYSFHFSYEDGAPDLQHQYNLEGISSQTGVITPPASPASAISDEWKIKFFGSVTNALAADNADPDGDGSSNLQEYLAGTDPTSTSSHLSVAVQTSGGSPTLTWLSAPGKSYYVETSASVGATVWTTIGGPILGDGTFQVFQAQPTVGGTHFYRIRLQP